MNLGGNTVKPSLGPNRIKGFFCRGVTAVKAMVCEMCGSKDFVKQDGLYACQHCGCKYLPEEAKKVYEIAYEAEADGISVCEQLLERGNTYLKLEDYKSAQDIFKEFITKYPHKRIGYEKYFTAISENFAEYFVYDLADPNTKAEINNIIEILKKIDDGRDTYDAEIFLKKVNDYLKWIDLKRQKEQNENILNELEKRNLYLSEQIDTAKSMQKRSVIVIAVFLAIGVFSLCVKSKLTVLMFLIVGFFLIFLALSARDEKNMSKMIDEDSTRKKEFEKEINILNDKLNKIKINW